MSAVGFRAVWRSHVLVGVPLAAFLHSVVQFASSAGFTARDLWLFLLHFLMGVVVGSVILVPALSIQAGLFQLLASWRVSESLAVGLCGAFQAAVVALWAVKVGIEPSLAGRFPLTGPMITAGFVAGAAAAYRAAFVVRRSEVTGG